MAIFEGENVELTEDILKKREDFIPTEAEWSAKNRRRVFLSASASGNLLTVAKNTTVYITSIHLSSSATSKVAVSNPTGIRIITSGNDKALIMHTHWLNTQEQSSSISFSMPFEVKSGEIINFLEGANIQAHVMVMGWEEPKKI